LLICATRSPCLKEHAANDPLGPAPIFIAAGKGHLAEQGLDAGLVSRPGLMKPGIKVEQLVDTR
jgi:hypothetical protein